MLALLPRSWMDFKGGAEALAELVNYTEIAGALDVLERLADTGPATTSMHILHALKEIATERIDKLPYETMNALWEFDPPGTNDVAVSAVYLRHALLHARSSTRELYAQLSVCIVAPQAPNGVLYSVLVKWDETTRKWDSPWYPPEHPDSVVAFLISPGGPEKDLLGQALTLQGVASNTIKVSDDFWLNPSQSN